MRVVLVVAFSTVLTAVAAREDKAFAPFISGAAPEQFELVGIGAGALKINDGELELSGKPTGYFATKGTYKNYILRFDWKYDRPEGLDSDAKFSGNSGLLVHIVGKHKVWPKCTEVQLANADAGNIFAIQGAKCEAQKDAAAQKKAIKPVGQWNSEEVTCRDGTITCKINDIQVASGTRADPDRGAIGWQSEGSVIRLRNVRIQILE